MSFVCNIFETEVPDQSTKGQDTEMMFVNTVGVWCRKRRADSNVHLSGAYLKEEPSRSGV